MKDFVRATINTELTQREIYYLVSQALPEFFWREGDSDAQGLYITGNKEDFGQIQIWFDEGAVDVTISLRAARTSGLNEALKEEFFSNVISNVLPIIGEVQKVIST